MKLQSQSSLKRVLVSEMGKIGTSTESSSTVAILFEASPGFGGVETGRGQMIFKFKSQSSLKRVLVSE